mmetsp:Transcript_52640/g.138230  ORF Transcript_52640/g.138230 Transcript_52640/m.138230 type:complete len:81 (+) Transcript_52640:3122-3364(+)
MRPRNVAMSGLIPSVRWMSMGGWRSTTAYIRAAAPCALPIADTEGPAMPGGRRRKESMAFHSETSDYTNQTDPVWDMLET